MTVTRRQVSVSACQGTLGCCVRTVRKDTSPMAPLAAYPVAVTPTELSTTSVTAQECVCVRRECTGPSVTSATQASSVSAARGANPASAITLLTTATHNLASV